jgi:hypothetical protein
MVVLESSVNPAGTRKDKKIMKARMKRFIRRIKRECGHILMIESKTQLTDIEWHNLYKEVRKEKCPICQK